MHDNSNNLIKNTKGKKKRNEKMEIKSKVKNSSEAP